MVELRILGYAYRKIGVPRRYMFVVLLVSLLGSHVNIPLFAAHVPRLIAPHDLTRLGRTYVAPPVIEAGRTIVAINLGGALLPLMLSLYLFYRSRMRVRMLVGVAIVAVIVHSLAEIVPGVGIAIPMFIPPVVAAAVGLVLAFREAPPPAMAGTWSSTSAAMPGPPSRSRRRRARAAAARWWFRPTSPGWIRVRPWSRATSRSWAASTCSSTTPASTRGRRSSISRSASGTTCSTST